MVYEALLGRPWEWIGPLEVTDEGITHFELRIRELPDFFVAGISRAEVLSEALPALKAFLDSYSPADRPSPAARRGYWQSTLLAIEPAIRDPGPSVQTPMGTRTAGGADAVPAFRRPTPA